MEEGELSDDYSGGRDDAVLTVNFSSEVSSFAEGSLIRGRHDYNTEDELVRYSFGLRISERSYRSNGEERDEECESDGKTQQVSSHGARRRRERERSLSAENVCEKRARRNGHRNENHGDVVRREVICKFYRDGHCKHGSNCAYSHDAEDSGRRAEVCKFYKRGKCRKGAECVFLHGESPCKAFHKGECSMLPCRFSHAPLNSFTKPIFEQMVREDMLASCGRTAYVCRKRHVLLSETSRKSARGIPSLMQISTMPQEGTSFVGSSSLVIPQLSVGTSLSISPSPGIQAGHGRAMSFSHHISCSTDAVGSHNGATNSIAQLLRPVAPLPHSNGKVATTAQRPEIVEESSEEKEQEDEAISIVVMLRRFLSWANNGVEEKRICYGFLADGCTHVKFTTADWRTERP